MNLLPSEHIKELMNLLRSIADSLKKLAEVGERLLEEASVQSRKDR